MGGATEGKAEGGRRKEVDGRRQRERERENRGVRV